MALPWDTEALAEQIERDLDQQRTSTLRLAVAGHAIVVTAWRYAGDATTRCYQATIGDLPAAGGSLRTPTFPSLDAFMLHVEAYIAYLDAFAPTLSRLVAMALVAGTPPVLRLLAAGDEEAVM